MRILIVEGAGSRGGLAAARSLARAGWEVGVGGPTDRSPTKASRSVRHRYLLPPLGADTEKYLTAVGEVLEERHYDMVVGAGDAEALALAAGRARVPALVQHPPYPVLLAAMDKLRLHRAAVQAGLSNPETCAGEDSATVTEWLRRGPVVVKPRLHWDGSRPAVPLRVEAGLARTLEQARRLVDTVTAAGAEALVQRFVTGQLIAYEAVLDSGGAVVAQAQQRAVHTWPEPVGVSARAVTEPVDRQLATRSVDLLRRLGLTGLAELQFLIDETGRRHLIDLNARYYGSLALAIAAGADLPRLWAEVTLGLRRTGGRAETARPAVRYQWLEGDLRRSVARREFTGVVRCLAHAGRSHHSIWSPHDPGPALAQAGDLTRRARRRMATS